MRCRRSDCSALSPLTITEWPRRSPDRDARYEAVARIMAVAARAGLARIGFVTEPARD